MLVLISIFGFKLNVYGHVAVCYYGAFSIYHASE